MSPSPDKAHYPRETAGIPRCCDWEEDEQCARCGSSMLREACETCECFGYYDEPDPQCPACHGTGMSVWCLSGYDWCKTHPRSGREAVKPHTPDSNNPPSLTVGIGLWPRSKPENGDDHQ